MPLDNEAAAAAAAADDGSESSPTAGDDARTTAERNRCAFHDNYTGQSPQLPKVKKPMMSCIFVGGQTVVALVGEGNLTSNVLESLGKTAIVGLQ